MSWGYIVNLITRTIKEWMEDDAMTYSAALAYYFVMGLPALLLLSVSIGSIFLKSEDIQYRIVENLQGVVDERVINMILLLFERIPTIDSLSISALVGLILLFWSASSFFRKLKDFLERAWDVKPTESNGVKDFTRDAIMASTIVIFFGGLLVISIVVEGIIYISSSWFHGIWPFSPIIANYAGSISSFLILVIFFMLIYRVLPDKSLDFKSIFVGSLVTVVLITIGKYAVGLSLKYSNPTSVYGAIGSIIGLFLLIFYTSMMITFGAEFTKVYSES